MSCELIVVDNLIKSMSSLQEAAWRLANYNQRRLIPGVSVLDESALEIRFIESIRAMVRDRIPAQPTYSWYEGLMETGPGQNDPLFDFLAEKATLDQMVWFLRQEAAGEAGFGDLVAMTQVAMPTRAKLEMARNYWDEMGNGREKAMHDLLLRDLVKQVGGPPKLQDTVLESLLLSCVMTAFACQRRYAYLSVGALGVIEMTAPARVQAVDRGLERLGFSAKDRQYFTLHGVLDVKHSRDWNREVIEPLSGEPLWQAAEGAYIRLWAGSYCYARYRSEFGLPYASWQI